MKGQKEDEGGETAEIISGHAGRVEHQQHFSGENDMKYEKQVFIDLLNFVLSVNNQHQMVSSGE